MSKSQQPQVMEVSEIDAGGAVARIDPQISTQIATAKRYPRDVPAAIDQARELALYDDETAESCFYALPRAGKEIEGPSVRLAEILANAWGNIRFGSRIVEHDGKQVTAEGFCMDLEKNTACTFQVKRRITDRSGRTYTDDMIVVTGNAAAAIAVRNAILKTIPGALWKGIYEACRKKAIGDSKTLASRRQKALAHFAKMGIREERLLAALELKHVDEIGLDEIEKLLGLQNALKDGSTTLDEAFPSADPGSLQPKAKSEAAPAPDCGCPDAEAGVHLTGCKVVEIKTPTQTGSLL